MLVYTLVYPSEFCKSILPKMTVEPGYKPNLQMYNSDENFRDVLYFPFRDNVSLDSPVKFVVILARIYGAYCFNILPDINFDIDSKATKREVISALSNFLEEFQENIQFGLVPVSEDVVANAHDVYNDEHVIRFFSGGDVLPSELNTNFIYTYRKVQAGKLSSAFNQALKSANK